MLLSDFSFQSSGMSYSMPSSPVSTSGGSIDGPRSMSSVLGYYTDQIRKRRKKKKKKRVADQFGVHQHPNRNETNITYDTNKKEDGNIEYKRRYERYGLTKRSSNNRERNGLESYVGHYTINR